MATVGLAHILVHVSHHSPTYHGTPAVCHPPLVLCGNTFSRADVLPHLAICPPPLATRNVLLASFFVRATNTAG
jgi:hypothetical protein